MARSREGHVKAHKGRQARWLATHPIGELRADHHHYNQPSNNRTNEQRHPARCLPPVLGRGGRASDRGAGATNTSRLVYKGVGSQDGVKGICMCGTTHAPYQQGRWAVGTPSPAACVRHQCPPFKAMEECSARPHSGHCGATVPIAGFGAMQVGLAEVRNAKQRATGPPLTRHRREAATRWWLHESETAAIPGRPCGYCTQAGPVLQLCRPGRCASTPIPSNDHSSSRVRGCRPEPYIGVVQIAVLLLVLTS